MPTKLLARSAVILSDIIYPCERYFGDRIRHFCSGSFTVTLIASLFVKSKVDGQRAYFILLSKSH
jgi:hypothetical protein